ncbi:hypothetical protein G6F22_010874 [Rhizopus arrhizus]|nr:hypothetical protein G6F22_010874 [Rhizopus arrhizus]
MVVAQHRGAEAAARQLVGGRNIRRLRTGGVHAIGRHQADVAPRVQVQIAGTGAQHAEILGMGRHRHPVGVTALAESFDHVAQPGHIVRHRRAGLEARLLGVRPPDPPAALNPTGVVMRVRQRQLAGGRPGQHPARIGRVQVGAGHQLHRPRLAARRQHLGHGPIAPLVCGRAGPQVHIVGASWEYQLGLRRNERALLERNGAFHQQHVRLIALRRVQIGQGHVRGPGERLQRRAAGQQRARPEARAGGQVHRLAQHRASAVQQLAGRIPHVAGQHRAAGQGQLLVERGLHRQAGARRQFHGLQGQGIVQRLAAGELGAVRKRDAAARQHHVAAKRLHAGGQHPAVLVVRRGGRRREAVVDAAVDVQVALGTQDQRADLAGAVYPCQRRARVHACVAVARQVQVALHHQIAVGGLADDFHARAQVEHVTISGVVQARQLAVDQVAIEHRCTHEGSAVVVLGLQVGLIDDLVIAAVGPVTRIAHLGIVIALHGGQRDRLGAVDHKRAARLNGDVAIAGGGPQRPAAVDFRVAGSIDARRQQFQRAALHAVELPRGGCTVAQVDTRAAGQGQHALA